jgi:signal transduction histidine kinase
MIRPPVEKLRFQLTLWYVATLCLILILLGGGVFLVVRRQLAEQLDDSLRSATTELMRAARIRETESASARGQVVDAVDELHIPDRQLFLFTASGEPVKPPSAEAWIKSAALRAAKVGRVDEDREIPDERTLRLYAERFDLASGTPMVAVAVADEIELEDRYAALIGVFGAASMVAVVLVTIGGSILVGKSARPVERAMEQMRRFMADAAHELRTPITVLRSRAEIALQQPRDSASYVAALRGVESESIRLGGIVDDLLMLARADAGERPTQHEEFQLDDLALDAAAAASVVAHSKQVGVVVGNLDRARIAGDPELVRRLMMILLDNGIKFTPPGREVRISVFSSDGAATLVVEDSGVGIPAEQLTHVFERFYRGDPARGRSEGAGLGLSIARWIADAHHAHIDISSTEREGTRVDVRFPAVVRAGAEKPEEIGQAL